ncbi:AAA domain-containing protein [Halovenus aranensis]|uniref:AAA domain-containing protein n=1 Tax=Halovenus aranensis TaxID=890420 RepID=A0A1G8Y279_9EURY|nr:AAA family ATPase [Halovenus aranensis]SDJ96969.1 AAA domain-containing protein [Halovenus aranensis]
MTRIVAVVGTAGGVGTTRLTVECGATLARAGRDVALVDAAFGTQGLRSYVDADVDADVTALLTEEASLGDVLYDIPVDTEGRLAAAPARAPFERLARAQTVGAAKLLERQLAASSLSYDVVLVDTPPLAGNHAVAAVNAAERVALVTEDTSRGRDGLALLRGRLRDIGASGDAVLRNRATEQLSEGVGIPESEETTAAGAPVCTTPDAEFAPAVATAVESMLDISLDLDFPAGSRLENLRG